MQRNSFMQLAAALCLMLGVFPVWYWFCTWAMPGTGMAFAFTGGSLVLTAAAWVHRKCGFPLERKSLLLAGILARAAAVLLGVGGWFLAKLFLPAAAAIGTGVLVGLVYLTAWEMLRLPAERLLSVHAFILVCVAYFAGLVLCWLQDRTVFGDVNFLALACNVAVFGFLRNRRSLKEATAGRLLPKGFYRHNSGLLVGFLVPGAVFFSFRKQIAALAGAILKALWQLFLKVWQLMSVRFYREEQSAEAEPGSQLPPAGGHDDTTWLEWVINLAVIGLAVFLVIRFRAELWDFLRQIVSGMFRFLRRLVLARAPEFPVESHPEYTDCVELLDTVPAHGKTEKKASWRQYYRKYRHIADPAEKYRAGYALWLRALKGWQADVPPNAVPARLLELSSGIPDPALTASITEVYYKVRYGGHIPSGQELAEMDKLVRTVRTLLLTVRRRIPR